VAKVGLDSAGVLAIRSKLEAAAVSQHVAVDQEAKRCSLAGASNHPLIACHAQGRATL
jgi:hypothetical protein